MSEGVAPADVAFYFVHWLTDLAGAEPSPLGGAEKLVLKFPHAVLDSFVRSFEVLNALAVKSETAVMEEYLINTWSQQHPDAGLVPRGEDAVALMRLSLQAQTPDKQAAVLAAWSLLSFADRSMLSDEMARSGIENQIFDRGPGFKQVFGPTFLVYYSPAFLRNMAPSKSLEALRILAEVYRRARELWPLRPTLGNAHSVTIRIDQIKELKLPAITSVFNQGESWLLVRKNDNEGETSLARIIHLRRRPRTLPSSYPTRLTLTLPSPTAHTPHGSRFALSPPGVVEKHETSAIAELSAQGAAPTVLKFWEVIKNDQHGRADSHSKGSRARSGSSLHDSGLSDTSSIRRGSRKGGGRVSPSDGGSVSFCRCACSAMLRLRLK